MSKCLCGGRLHDKWEKWRKVKGVDSASQTSLYCLGCRQKWISRAKYARIMRTHTPECRSGLTDDDILKLLISGELRVDVVDAKVFKGKRELIKVERTHKDGPRRGTYRFVSICDRGKKKKIAVHRLVWIASTLSLPPEGFDVDHRNNNTDDGIDNLRLLESGVNRALGNSHHTTEPSF